LVGAKVPLLWNLSAFEELGAKFDKPQRLLRAVWGGTSDGAKGQSKHMTRQTSGAASARPNRLRDGEPLGANSEIGRKLKQYYDELVSDEVPDRFAQLLSQLEQAEPEQQKD